MNAPLVNISDRRFKRPNLERRAREDPGGTETGKTPRQTPVAV